MSDETTQEFPTRTMTRSETWSRRCVCKYFMPDEYEVCDSCLVRRFAAGMNHDAAGSCDHYESGYTDEQVARIIRRVRGEIVVLPRVTR